jgi:hypothetical protein
MPPLNENVDYINLMFPADTITRKDFIKFKQMCKDKEQMSPKYDEIGN